MANLRNLNTSSLKRRFAGITIFGILFIIRGVGSLGQYEVNPLLAFLGATSIIIGIGLLRLMNVARVSAILLILFLLLWDIYLTYIGVYVLGDPYLISPTLFWNLIFFVIVFYYFTRPKVIEQFKEKFVEEKKSEEI